MGAVYLAHDTKLDRQVALKVPFFHPADGPQAVQRFEREARAAATLDHPNLCPVYDVGEVDGIHYLTMPYIEGKPLSEAIARGPDRHRAPRPRPWPASSPWRSQEAHDRGVIHRDLKPGNIMVNRRRDLVIMDFGLARMAGGDGDAPLTRTGHVLGHGALHGPRAGRRGRRRHRPGLRHLQPGRDPLRAADRPPPLRRALVAGHRPEERHGPRPALEAPARPRPRPRRHLPEGHRQEAGGPLRRRWPSSPTPWTPT